MGKKRSTSQPTISSEVARHETCVECGYTGQLGSEVVPYSFAKKDYRWLCWAFSGRDCLKVAWAKFTA